MPSLLTHYFCGDEMLKNLRDKQLYSNIEKYRQVFNIGTQGPDIFFYYKVWPWLDSMGVNELGERMHAERVNRFFLNAAEYIKSKEGEEKQLLTAYLCGFLCHYALDFNAHPFITYGSGLRKPDEAPGLKYSYYHRRFETALDVLMTDRIISGKPFDAKPYKLISVTGHEAKVIGRMYDSVLNKTFDMELPPGIAERTIADMINTRRIMQDRWGIKRNLVELIEKVQGHYPTLAVMILPSKIEDGRDYLNLENRVWYYPWDNSVKKTESFIDLFENAAKDAQILCSTLFDWLCGEIDDDALIDAIGNKSFSTGIDCSRDVKFIYSDCIFE